jgi:hypothetical protein
MRSIHPFHHADADDRISNFLPDLACWPLPSPPPQISILLQTATVQACRSAALCVSASRWSCSSQHENPAPLAAETIRLACGGWSLWFANLRRAALETGNCPWLSFNFIRRYTVFECSEGILGELTSSRPFYVVFALPCLALNLDRGSGASRPTLDSCAPPVRFWSRSGAGKGTRTGHVRRSTWTSEGTTPRGSQGFGMALQAFPAPNSDPAPSKSDGRHTTSHTMEPPLGSTR